MDSTILFVADFVPFLSTLAFIGIFLGIMYGMGHLSGWKKMSGIYPFVAMGGFSAQSTESVFVKFARFSKSQYNGSMRAIATAQGLVLRHIFLFKLGHPTLLIPWNEIQEKGEEEYKYEHPSGEIGRRMHESGVGRMLSLQSKKGRKFVFQRTPDVSIVVDMKTAEFILRKKKEFGF